MKGSFTIEAALVLTVIVFILGWILKESIILYQQVEQTAIERELDALKPVEIFRRLQWIEEIKKQVEG